MKGEPSHDSENAHRRRHRDTSRYRPLRCRPPTSRSPTIDFLKEANLAVNGAGPVLVRMDALRNRLIVANTLSSSISFIDCRDHSVLNVPVQGRALQHLKAEALTFRRKTGEVYLIGSRCFSIASSDGAASKTIPTGAQFESIAVDEATGNAFLAGRESRELGFYSAKSGKLAMLPWLATREDLINLNATPPPPIRKVVAAPELKSDHRRRRLYVDPLPLRRAKRKTRQFAGGQAHERRAVASRRLRRNDASALPRRRDERPAG